METPQWTVPGAMPWRLFGSASGAPATWTTELSLSDVSAVLLGVDLNVESLTTDFLWFVNITVPSGPTIALDIGQEHPTTLDSFSAQFTHLQWRGALPLKNQDLIEAQVASASGGSADFGIWLWGYFLPYGSPLFPN